MSDSGKAPNEITSAPVIRKPRKKKLVMDMPLLYVEWEDHHSQNSWQLDEEIERGPCLCRSVGWLYEEDDKGMILVGSVSSAPSYSDTRYLLKSCITNQVVLSAGKKKLAKKGEGA